jgi:broad specificity phosphatase PhoE
MPSTNRSQDVATPGAVAHVYIARHGQVPANCRGLYAGRSGEPLTEEGRRQAEALSERVSGCGIAEVWTSEIARAVETAEIVGARLGVPMRRERRLNEMLLGSWEGLTEEEVADRFPDQFWLWNERPDQLCVEGRETLAMVAERAQAVVSEAALGSRPVLLVTHVALVRVVALRILGLPLGRYKAVAVPNGEVMMVGPAAGTVRRLGTGHSLREELAPAGAGELR